MAYDNDANLYARIAKSVINGVYTILEEYGLQIHEVGG
jgi:antitoxin component of RelBE/YafQ-DinJ toxin-antitoxin module